MNVDTKAITRARVTGKAHAREDNEKHDKKA